MGSLGPVGTSIVLVQLGKIFLAVEVFRLRKFVYPLRKFTEMSDGQYEGDDMNLAVIEQIITWSRIKKIKTPTRADILPHFSPGIQILGSGVQRDWRYSIYNISIFGLRTQSEPFWPLLYQDLHNFYSIFIILKVV